MRRRRGTVGDSLELLLDTMCNAFGGIILIALLVALLTRDLPAHRIEAGGPDAGELKARLRDRTERIENLRGRLAELTQSREIDPERLDLILNLRELQDELQETRRQTASLDQARQKLETRPARSAAEEKKALETEIASLEQSLDQDKRMLNATETRLREKSSELGRLAQSVERLESTVVQRVRLPREHTTTRRPLDVVVQFGEVFPIYYFRDGEPYRNDLSLIWSRGNGADIIVRPQPGKGIDPSRQAAEWARFLQTIPRDSHYLVFHVYEDSFASFNVAKRAAAGMGVQFGWTPLEKNKTLVAGSGSQPPPPL